MAKVDWNPGEHEARAGFEPVPAGRYLTVITDSEDKQTKNKDGHYFEFEFEVVKPEAAKRRKLWSRMNYQNPSEAAQRIGREEFSALCVACDVDRTKISDTVMLHGKAQVCIVVIETTDRGPTNRITGWLKPTANDRATAEKYMVERAEAKKTGKGSAGKGKPDKNREEAKEANKKRVAATDMSDLDDDIPF